MENRQVFGVMLDLSRNAVMKPKKIKEFIDLIKKFGYNALYLYTEDTYEIEGEPYFGHLRGKLLKSEIKDIVEFGENKGVEIIPCIQTLAHLNQIFKWPHVYSDIRDTQDILLCDSEKTYALIEKMFITIRECYKTNLVNIGMDEAHFLGLGKYLTLNGYKNRFEILSKHLNRVLEIAKKYGFKPIMWSDMYFRLCNNGAYYVDKVDKKALSEVKKYVPNGVSLCLWDYYHESKKDYDVNFSAHKELTDDVSFAGAVTSWQGFAPYNKGSMNRLGPAMDGCREKGIKNILIAMWGDNGKECSFYSCLPALFYSAERFRGNKNLKDIKKKFYDIVGVKFDDFLTLDLLNVMPNSNFGSTCKSMLYNDPFASVMDGHVTLGDGALYKKYTKKILSAGKRSGEYKYVFDYLGSLSSVMEYKLDLGLKTRKAYRENDVESLKEIESKIYPTLIKRLKVFYENFKKVWDTENKPFGFEVQDIRIGGLILRLSHCREVLKNYLDKKIDKIEELDEDILPYVPDIEGYKVTTDYLGAVTANIF